MRPRFMKSLSTFSTEVKEPMFTASSNSEDIIVQSLLKQCKELESLLTRFNLKKYNSHKSSGILKSNLLRTSLLSFLRSKNLLAFHFSPNSLVYSSLLDVVLTVLLRWWTLLIANLNCKVASASSPSMPQNMASALRLKLLGKSRLMTSLASGADDFVGDASFACSPIPVSDRHAYLECISRIISRSDWIHADSSAHIRYQSLMTQTLEMCIAKMTHLKSFLMANAAFTGKVFAYSFVALPGVSDALLFLLNVRQSTFDCSLESLNLKSTNAATDHLREIFPAHLHHLINYRGLQDGRSSRRQTALNCLPTPLHPVPGIIDPNAGWVRRWCNCDSNVYNSFFKHYVDIMHRTLVNASSQTRKSVDIDEHSLLYMCPGFTVVNAHIYQVILLSLLRMAHGLPQKPPPGNRAQGLDVYAATKTATPPLLAPIDVPVPPPLPPLNEKQFGVYYSSVIKHFKTLRYIVYNTCASTESIYVGDALVGAVDRALISLAREISIHDHQRNGLILSISLEFFNHIHGISHEAMRCIDWEFWLSCAYMMVCNADLVQVLLKNFSFLFNIWDIIPVAYAEHEIAPCEPSCQWLKNSAITLQDNFAHWIISDDILTRFIGHWNPAVRSYYMRFVIWRVIGVNNALSMSQVSITHALQAKLDAIHTALRANTNPATLGVDTLLAADCPFVNRRFCIVPISAKDENGFFGGESVHMSPATGKTNDLRKTSPYEIYDEAVYTCASPLVLSMNDGESLSEKRSVLDDLSSPKSLVATLGKFFKNWGPQDDKSLILQGFAESKTRAGSLSASSIDCLSNSSNPSLSSFGSAPTSRSYSTAASSLNSDFVNSDAKLIVGAQASESSRDPPEVDRPVFKFDVVWDHESIQKKQRLIAEKNTHVPARKHREYHSKEHPPGARASHPSKSGSLERVLIPLMALSCEPGRFAEFIVDDHGRSSELDFDGPEFSVLPKIVPETKIDKAVMGLGPDQPARALSKYVLNGRGLNEFNALLDEFIDHVNHRIQLDQFNPEFDRNYAEHVRRLYPFLAVDCSSELRLLNAS